MPAEYGSPVGRRKVTLRSLRIHPTSLAFQGSTIFLQDIKISPSLKFWVGKKLGHSGTVPPPQGRDVF